jgi:hypothetical protein
MNNLTGLKTVNAGLGMVFAVQAVTGLGQKFLAGEWAEQVHQAGGIVLVVLVLAHLTLNRAWIKANFFARKSG